MNPKIAKQSLEALEILSKDIPWKPEKRGRILRYGSTHVIIDFGLSGSKLILGYHKSGNLNYVPWLNVIERYLPTDRQLDQWIIDWNKGGTLYSIKSDLKQSLYGVWSYYNNPDPHCGRFLMQISYTNAEEQYLAKCQVIAAAYKLTRER